MSPASDRPASDLLTLFDRLASIGRAMQRARKQRADLDYPVAKLGIETGQNTQQDKPAAQRDFTLDGGSQQKGVQP